MSRNSGVVPITRPMVAEACRHCAMTLFTTCPGATPEASGTEPSASACTSEWVSSVRCVAVAVPPLPFGNTIKVLPPSWSMEASTDCCEPVPIATNVMTAATPIAIPRIVSAERVFFATMLSTANRKLSCRRRFRVSCRRGRILMAYRVAGELPAGSPS